MNQEIVNVIKEQNKILTKMNANLEEIKKLYNTLYSVHTDVNNSEYKNEEPSVNDSHVRIELCKFDGPDYGE